jgi:glycosyltransferase involved in cell wall biosynthesis
VKKIRILHIQLLPLLSGVQNAMLNLITNLDSNEFEFYVISAPNGPLVDRLNELKIKHSTIPELKRKINIKDVIVFLKFYRICRKHKFDIVHTHSSKTGFLGRIAAKLAGIKVVLHTIHGFPFNPFQPIIQQKFYKLLEKIASYFCDKAISVNQSERVLAIEQNIIPAKKIKTIYNGVKENLVASKICRQKIGFSNDDIIIGSVNRFSKQKNILNLIKIAIKVAKENNRIKFIFLGSGELWKDAKDLVKANKLSSKILLLGWMLNISDWLELFDIFILYSRWEGLSLSILEAMAAGKPIIASDIKGNNELVEDGENGFLVKIGDHRSLIERIIWLASHKAEREEMGRQSLKIVREKFSLSQFVNSYRKEYINLYQTKL